MRVNYSILDKMLKDLDSSPKIYQPSKHWKKLNILHIEQLGAGKIQNFKRSVNMKYFNWGILGIMVHQMRPIFQEILVNRNFTVITKTSFKSYNAKLGNKITEFDFISAQVYKIFVASLYYFVKRSDTLNLLDKLEEPLVGNPFTIRHKNKVITQDLLNSILEFYSSNPDSNINSKINIAEIGAGYGRLAYVYLNALPRCTYTIIDIPLALYLSQEYLKEVMPKEKIFYYRSFKNYKEIKKEFESSRIRFLMADQINLIPKRSVDVFINVSSLHEMSRSQIRNYLKQINRLTSGYFYTKQWFKSRVADNNYISETEYPIPKKWKKIFQRRHPVQGMFFEGLYKI